MTAMCCSSALTSDPSLSAPLRTARVPLLWSTSWKARDACSSSKLRRSSVPVMIISRSTSYVFNATSTLLRRFFSAVAMLGIGALAHMPGELEAQRSGNGPVAEPLPTVSEQLQSPYPTLIPGMAAVPFTIGERLQYDVKFSWKSVGTGVMEVKEIVDVRGRPSWHTVFTIKGGIPFFRVDDSMESWFDVFTLSSRRFHQRVQEGGYKRTRLYEMYPERAVFREGNKEEEPSVNSPLDDGSFLYYVRTIPLEVGKTYEVPRYFNPAANPVRITVVRRETIQVPAGEYKTVVLRPTFQSRGIFSEDGKAEVWISDDEYRIMVQMKTSLKIGSINLYLEDVKLPPGRTGNMSRP